MRTTTSNITTDSFSMDYFSFGSGKTPFVMLPGIYTKPMNTLAELVACSYNMFAQQFTTYVFDRRPPLKNGYNINDLADDTAAALDILGIKNACVFGVSMGGMTAQTLAVKRPDLVQKLALASTTSRISERAAKMFNTFLGLASSGDTDAMSLAFAKAVYTPAFFERFKDAIITSLQGSTPQDIDRFVTLTKGILSFDIYDKLATITCPTLVIAGSEDAVFSPQDSRDIAEKTRAELCIYDGYGHAVYDEAPDIKQKLFAFFTK